MKALIIVGLMAGGLLLGCSSMSPLYPNTHEKNVTVNLTLGSGDRVFTSTNVYAGVADIGKDCTGAFQGYVALSPGPNKIGLAPGQATYLTVKILHRFLNDRSSFSHGALITPKAGKNYEVDVSYIDSMLDLRVYEVDKSGRSELKTPPMPACKSAK